MGCENNNSLFIFVFKGDKNVDGPKHHISTHILLTLMESK